MQVDRVLVTSDLTRTELMRAVTRIHAEWAQKVRAVLDSVETVGLTRRVLDEAGRLAPVTLRSLDAIHLATALSFGDDLESIVTYDDRLAAAAQHAGLVVTAPGAMGLSRGFSEIKRTKVAESTAAIIEDLRNPW